MQRSGHFPNTQAFWQAYLLSSREYVTVLKLAQENGIPVYVVSEGPLELLQARLHALGLDPFAAGALCAAKSPDLYARLRQRAAPRSALMIGDQPDRDIRFAHEAGLKTIYVRGRFQPSWAKMADVRNADAVAENFLDAVEWAVKWNSGPSPETGAPAVP